MKPHTAGALIERVAFDKLGTSSDGYGGTTDAWAEQWQCRAAYLHLRGGEGVQAARLEGRHLQVIRVRASASTRSVTSDWRVRDVRSGAVYNVRDIEPSADRMWLDFLCERGVAA